MAARKLVARLVLSQATCACREPPTGHLRPRRTNNAIAVALYVSSNTVKTHVASLLRKLGLRDRTQAAVAAYELGLVRPGG